MGQLPGSVLRVGIAPWPAEDAESYDVIVDTGGSKLNMGIGYAPCLTASRCQARAFVDLRTARRLSLSELLRLQGFTNEEMVGLRFTGSALNRRANRECARSKPHAHVECNTRRIETHASAGRARGQKQRPIAGAGNHRHNNTHRAQKCGAKTPHAGALTANATGAK